MNTSTTDHLTLAIEDVDTSVDQPTVYGWHSFALHTTTARCMGCHGIVPVEALADGSWRWRIGGRCREFLRAIGPAR